MENIDNSQNKNINRIIKNVLRLKYKEDKNIKNILSSFNVKSFDNNFSYRIFKNDIRHALNCITKCRFKNFSYDNDEVVILKKNINQINEYVSSKIKNKDIESSNDVTSNDEPSNDEPTNNKPINNKPDNNKSDKYRFVNIPVNDSSVNDKINKKEYINNFFEDLNNFLNINFDENMQKSISYFIKSLFNNKESKYLLNLFKINNPNIDKLFIYEKIFKNEDINLIISISNIIKFVENDKFLTKFLLYDLEYISINFFENINNLLKYNSIINSNNSNNIDQNNILKLFLKSHVSYMIKYYDEINKYL